MTLVTNVRPSYIFHLFFPFWIGAFFFIVIRLINLPDGDVTAVINTGFHFCFWYDVDNLC